MVIAVLAVLALGLGAGGAGCEAYMPYLVPATVTCMGSACTSCVHMPIDDLNDTKILLNPCIQIDFEDRDMAVHFLGVMDGVTILEKEISGVTPPMICSYRVLMLCLRFHDVNSVGNSLQVCAVLEGGLVNNPAAAMSRLGCFVADTQTRTVRHRTSPRPQGKAGGRGQG